MAKKTFYEILGVSSTATEEQIKQAYRQLAREYHPDVNDSPDAEDRFKEINLAYATLSDSLKRADYDQSLRDPGVRGADAAPGAPAAPPAADSPYRRAVMRAAFARTFASAGVVGLIGLGIAVIVKFAAGQTPDMLDLALSLISGLALGGLYGADLNFKVETFLGDGWLGRSYTFTRTIVMSLALAYLGSLIGGGIDRAIGNIHIFGPGLLLLGVLTGAVVGSDGDTPEKVRSGSGRFNLFYTFMRGGEVGAVGGLIGLAIGGILAAGGIKGVWQWSGFTGFCLGMIVGSIKPPNLAAYASYASASVKDIIIILMVLGALLAGLAFGTAFHPDFANLFGGR